MKKASKTLHLSLKKLPFDVMVTGEKDREFREPSQWIKSRLFNKNGTRKDYHFVKFTHGYGADKPYFIAEFKELRKTLIYCCFSYSNGLVVDVDGGSFVIVIGKIVESGNIRK